MTKAKAPPTSVLTGVYYALFAIIEPLMALNGTYLTWFHTTKFFHDSAPYANSLQTNVLDPGTKLAIWQLGYSWMMVFLNSIILFHAIPKALPNDLAAQERLMSYLILGLMVGDIGSFVSQILVLPQSTLLDPSKWSPVVFGNVPMTAVIFSIRLAWVSGLGRPTVAKEGPVKKST